MSSVGSQAARCFTGSPLNAGLHTQDLALFIQPRVYIADSSPTPPPLGPAFQDPPKTQLPCAFPNTLAKLFQLTVLLLCHDFKNTLLLYSFFPATGIIPP